MRKSETAAAPGLDPARETAVAGFLPFVFLRGGGGFGGREDRETAAPVWTMERDSACAFSLAQGSLDPVCLELVGLSVYFTGPGSSDLHALKMRVCNC